MLKFIKHIVEKYEKLNEVRIVVLSLFISLILTFIVGLHDPIESHRSNIRGIFLNYFPMIFLNIAPIMLFFRSNFTRKVKKNPLYAVGVIMYFLLFAPLFLSVQSSWERKDIDNGSIFFIGIIILNLIALLLGHIVLIKYVFLDVIFKRRKPAGRDVSIVMMTYLTLGVSFGFTYAVITRVSAAPAFINMTQEMSKELGNTKLYFRHIYYSFITLTSVGFGEIYPISWIAQLVTVIEATLGVFLLSFSLGIILSTGLENNYEEKKKVEMSKEDLLQEVYELLKDKFEN